MKCVWMGVVIGAVMTSGCQTPNSTEASVDVAKVVQLFPLPASPAPVQSVYPRVRIDETMTLPAQSAQRIVTPAKDIERVRATIRQQQEETRVRLEKQLKQFYTREGRRFELDRLQNLTEAERAAYAEISDQIRAEFERIAALRMPRVARLAFLAGFPDPNPESVLPEKPLGNVSRARFEEAKKLRLELAELDAQFDAFITRLLRNTEDRVAIDRAATRVQIELYKTELDARAEAEAKAQVAAAAQSLRLALAEGAVIDLPAVPEKSVRVRGPQMLPPMPRVTSKRVKDRRRELIESQVRIWAAQNRITLKSGAPDRTEEFLTWQKKRGFGL